MKATIAICTYNRADDLGAAIESCLSQDYHPSEYEIIVVDNRSTDRTADVVRKYGSLEAPKVRYIYEENLGLSYARNRAISEAAGEFILFLDDDAIASKRWLREIVTVFQQHSGIGCIGGKIEPLWEGGNPTWIPDRYKTLYSILDYSPSLTELKAPAIPMGANVAFRRQIFEVIKPFRVDLGRVGTNLLSSEESELVARIRKKYKIYYSPAASVKHKIARERTTKKWFFRRIYWQGVSDAVRTERKSKFFFKQACKVGLAALALIFTFYSVRRRIQMLGMLLHGTGAVAGVLGNHKG